VAVACAVVLALSLGATAAGETAPDPASLHGPVGIAAGSDGALWVADSLGVMRVTLDGHFTRVLQADQLRGITRGPDDAIWVTQQYPAPRIGRIAADGAVTWFGAGISHPPRGITAGPDGNLWFTEIEGIIGRITPAGAVTEFSKADSEPMDVTAGNDGNVWFSDFRGRIGRVTPSGEITEFDVPVIDYAGPEAIARGRHGALWYGTDRRVGRVTTAGRARLFKVPFDIIGGIALGSDGNMWVAGYSNKPNAGAIVARVTNSGKVRVFRQGLSGYSTEVITSGPGRALSVAENGRQVDEIARVSTTGAVRELPATPPCIVPPVARLPLSLVESRTFDSLCRIDSRSRRAGKRRGTVALGVSPKPGTTLPFNTAVHVHFGAVPPLPRHCRRPFAGRSLLATPGLHVFAYTDWDPPGEEATTRYVACLDPNGPPRQVTRSTDNLSEYSEASGFKAAGDFIVYSFFYVNHYNQSDTQLSVFDVRRARHVLSVGVERHGGDLEDDPPDNPLLGEYVVSEHGAVAWLSHEGPTTRLFAQVRGGARRELDSGASLSGLSFSGDTLSWTGASGEPKSAEVR
jgi:streptogramin lyase